MGRQSARLWFGRDHKDIFYNGSYHKAMYLTDKNANAELVWQKIKDDDYFSVRVVDYMADYETGKLPEGGQAGYVEFTYLDGHTSIDWGDGTVDKKRRHTYPTSNGTQYVVKIYGDNIAFQALGIYMDKGCSCVTEILTPIKRGMAISHYDEANGQVPSFNGMFMMCPLLKSIPDDLFLNVNDYENVMCRGVFEASGIESVPTGLFNGVKNWDIANFYANCKNITTVPFGAFTGGEFVISADIFLNCTNLRFVYDFPAGSYPDFEGAPIEVFDCYLYGLIYAEGLFAGLSTLKTISDKLFNYCPDMTTLKNCFKDCVNLESIPVGLFDGLDKVENYDYCFSRCSKIDSIPADLFEDSYSANTFVQCFAGCTGLTAIPLGLFDSCKDDSEFGGTFSGCSNVTSSVPDLWNYTENGYRCFSGCADATNYDEIPDDWK